MDLPEYLRLLRRRWRILLACVLVAGVAAWVTTPSEPTGGDLTYTATHQLLRDNSATAPAALATVSLFVKTGVVPERAAERLDYDGEAAVLAAGVTVEADEQVGTLEITATGNSRSRAAEVANVFAEELLAFLGQEAAAAQREQIELANEDIATLQIEIDELEDQIAVAELADESTSTLEAARDSLLRQYGAALDQQRQVLDQPPPTAGYLTLQPALPELASLEGGGFAAPSSRSARTAIGIFVGLVLGLGVVLLAERLDTRLHDVKSMGTAFGLPVIAEVPKVSTKRSDRRILSAVEPMSAMAESYRSVRSALVLSPVTVLGSTGAGDPVTKEDPRVILVTSPAPGDGKTTTVANLALTMSEAGRSVLVLGCDFRRPEIHTYFGVTDIPGIAEVLTGEPGYQRLEDVVRPTMIRGVSIAPSGGRLRSFGDVAAVGRVLIEEARSLADVVIVDTPPLLATNDASELIPACDAVVVVSRVGKTSADGARRTRFLLERLGAPVAGIVAVAVPDVGSSYASYYVDSAPAETGSEGRHVRTRDAARETGAPSEAREGSTTPDARPAGDLGSRTIDPVAEQGARETPGNGRAPTEDRPRSASPAPVTGADAATGDGDGPDLPS